MKATKTKRQAVRRLRRRLDRAGLLARAAAVSNAARSEAFAARLNAAVSGERGDSIQDAHDLRRVAEGILDEMGVDRRDVALTFRWDPETRKLDIWARPAHAKVMQIAKDAKLRAVGPHDQPKG